MEDGDGAEELEEGTEIDQQEELLAENAKTCLRKQLQNTQQVPCGARSVCVGPKERIN